MDILRRRVPYRLLDLDDNDSRILDEQEQEALIKTLRENNHTSSQQHTTALRIIIILSLFLHSISFSYNPLLVIFPPPITRSSPSIPLPALFTLLSIVLHINLALLTSLDHIKLRFRISHIQLHPLSYQLSYALSAVAPTLSLFLQRPWQSTVWWSITTAVVFTTHSVTSSIEAGNKNISELESMRYVAPGA